MSKKEEIIALLEKANDRQLNIILTILKTLLE